VVRIRVRVGATPTCILSFLLMRSSRPTGNAQNHGGQWVKKHQKDVYAILVDEGSGVGPNKFGIPLLMPQYIFDCVEEGALLVGPLVLYVGRSWSVHVTVFGLVMLGTPVRTVHHAACSPPRSRHHTDSPSQEEDQYIIATSDTASRQSSRVCTLSESSACGVAVFV
jgi:hypothetical protein